MTAPLAALGIDVGSTTTKLVGVGAGGDLAWHWMEPTDPRVEDQAQRLLGVAEREGGAAAGLPLIATGYGRNLIKAAFRTQTEIGCHARGVYRALGHGGTLIDIGGQDTKVISVAFSGSVTNFAMNDKCAAGTGRFLEVTAARLRVPLESLSEVALAAQGEVSISSTCTVFAESEIVSLIARGTPVDQIVRGLLRSLVRRVAALARSTGLSQPVLLSGGVARGAAVCTLLQDELKLAVKVPPHPQLMGAYGAALAALAQEPASKPR